MKVLSFNANGIRSAIRKGFYDWIQAQEDLDFICIQETKLKASECHHLDTLVPQGYYAVFEDAQKRGYSGVAIFSKRQPQAVQRRLGFEISDHEGRFLQFDYPAFSIVSLYLPSGSSGPERQSVKMSFLEQFQNFLQQQRHREKPLIICGDWNIAHKPIDLKNWKTNQKTSGFLPEERAWMDGVFGDLAYVDAFRVKNAEPDQYTWWSLRQKQARANNVGWRIDYQVVTPNLLPHIAQVAIIREPFFSDHAPLLIEYQGIHCD